MPARIIHTQIYMSQSASSWHPHITLLVGVKNKVQGNPMDFICVVLTDI